MEFRRVCRALYKYEAEEEGELSFEEDALIYVFNDEDENWWEASFEMNKPDSAEVTGLIPRNYVEDMEHISVVQAIYDYEATNEDEISLTEGDKLLVYQKEGEDWMLVKLDQKFGFIPQSYVEEIADELIESNNEDVGGYHEEVNEEAPEEQYEEEIVPEEETAQEEYDNENYEKHFDKTTPAPVQVVAPSTPRRNIEVAPQTKKKASKEDMLFWRVQEVDKKRKTKKKVRLGVSSDIFFFASEEDKAAPVKQWPTRELLSYGIRSKHIIIELGGDSPHTYDFSCNSVKQAEAIAFKIRACSAAQYNEKVEKSGGFFNIFKSKSSTPAAPPRNQTRSNSQYKQSTPQVSAQQSYEETPLPPLPNISSNIELGDNGKIATVLYDFISNEEDELSVQANERINVIDSTSDAQWWKCRVYYDNGEFKEGLVPADYVKLVPDNGDTFNKSPDSKDPVQDKKSSGSGPNLSNVREWTDATGSFRVEAEFIKYEDSKIYLFKVNGVKIAVPLEKMSNVDVHYVSDMIGKDLSTSLETTRKLKAEVAKWKEFFKLAEVGLAESEIYANTFVNEKLDRVLIQEYDKEGLKNLGLTEGDALRVIKAIKTNALDKTPKHKRSVTFGENTTTTIEDLDDEAIALRMQQEEIFKMRRERGSNELKEYQIEQDEMLARKLQAENSDELAWTNFGSGNSNQTSKFGLSLSGAKDSRSKGGIDKDVLFKAGKQLESEILKGQPSSSKSIDSKDKKSGSGFDDDIWGVPQRPDPSKVKQRANKVAETAVVAEPEEEVKLEKKVTEDPWKAFGDSTSTPKSETETPIFANGGSQRQPRPKARSATEENWGFVANGLSQTGQQSSQLPTNSMPTNLFNTPVQPTNVPLVTPSPHVLLTPLVPIPANSTSNIFVPTRRAPPPKPANQVGGGNVSTQPNQGVTTRAMPKDGQIDIFASIVSNETNKANNNANSGAFTSSLIDESNRGGYANTNVSAPQARNANTFSSSNLPQSNSTHYNSGSNLNAATTSTTPNNLNAFSATSTPAIDNATTGFLDNRYASPAPVVSGYSNFGSTTGGLASANNPNPSFANQTTNLYSTQIDRPSSVTNLTPTHSSLSNLSSMKPQSHSFDDLSLKSLGFASKNTNQSRQFDYTGIGLTSSTPINRASSLNTMTSSHSYQSAALANLNEPTSNAGSNPLTNFKPKSVYDPPSTTSSFSNSNNYAAKNDYPVGGYGGSGYGNNTSNLNTNSLNAGNLSTSGVNGLGTSSGFSNPGMNLLTTSVNHLQSSNLGVNTSSLGYQPANSSLYSTNVGQLNSGLNTNLNSGLGSTLGGGLGTNLNPGLNSSLGSNLGGSLSGGFNSNLNGALSGNLNTNLNNGLNSNMANGLNNGLNSSLGSGLNNNSGGGFSSGLNSNLGSGLSTNLGSNLSSGLNNGLNNNLGGGLSNGLNTNLSSNFNSSLYQTNYPSLNSNYGTQPNSMAGLTNNMGNMNLNSFTTSNQLNSQLGNQLGGSTGGIYNGNNNNMLLQQQQQQLLLQQQQLQQQQQQMNYNSGYNTNQSNNFNQQGYRY